MKTYEELFGSNPNIAAWVADLHMYEPYFDSAIEQMMMKLDIDREQAESLYREINYE